MTVIPNPTDDLDLADGLDLLVDLRQREIEIDRVLRTLLQQASAGRATSIGFPGATDIDYSAVQPFFGSLWNNVGDPATDPGGTAHTKPLERAVLDWFGDLLAMPAEDRWGYLTTGGTEGNEAALYAARQRHPYAMAYYSQAAHYSIAKTLHKLNIEAVAVRVDVRGEMDYGHLGQLLNRHRRRPAIVIATAGTTMTEAIDDTTRIHALLQSSRISRWHLHVDAALAGVPLALDGALRLDQMNIDSVAISGHKFFGTPIPCGIVLMHRSIRARGQHIPYTATLDTTVTGSRCGQAAVLLWHAIATHRVDGHRTRVRKARDLAAYTTARLTAMGWPAWRHPKAFTVVLATPPASVRRKWLLATEGDHSHTICMPGITHEQMDAFVSDMEEAVHGRRSIPVQRIRRAVPGRIDRR